MMNKWVFFKGKESKLKNNDLLWKYLKEKLKINQNSEVEWKDDFNLISSKLKNFRLSKYTLVLFNSISKEIFILLASADRTYSAGRNTFLSQGFKSFLKLKIQLEEKLKLKIDKDHVFLFIDNFNSSKKMPDSILISIQSFLTVYGKNSLLNNESKLNNIKIFNSLDEFIDIKTKVRGKNSGNNATFIEKATIYSKDGSSSNYINAFLKFDGANAGDSLLIYETLRFFYVGSIYIYWLKESLEKSDYYLYQNLFLKDNKLIFSSGEENINNITLMYKRERNEEFIAKRNQAKFHNNLFHLFGKKECLLCKVSIPDLIVGSHIKRVTDILNDKNLNENQKQFEIENENNGFWLCVLHDKMFERGRIWFEKNNVRIWDTQSENYINFIEETLQKKEYDKKFLTNERIRFQKAHYLRISSSISSFN